MFLKKLQLENFKCYKKATIPFKKLSIIVGENNAGKSCLIESLRLVSKAAQASRKRVYNSVPTEFELPANIKGFAIDTQKLKIDLRIIIYYYKSSNHSYFGSWVRPPSSSAWEYCSPPQSYRRYNAVKEIICATYAERLFQHRSRGNSVTYICLSLLPLFLRMRAERRDLTILRIHCRLIALS